MQIAPFALEQWMNRFELDVKYDIAESGMAPLSVEELLAFEKNQEQENAINQLTHGYNDANGSVALREEIAKNYLHCTDENILVTIGAIEANHLVFQSFLNAGDHVVVQYPAYQQLFSVPEAMRCDVVYWRCTVNGDEFKFDLDELKRLIKPYTKLIVVNTPHNPTGAILNNEEMTAVYRMAEAVGAYVLSDEAYRWLHIPNVEYSFTPAFNLGPFAISTGTMSKSFGLPGLRIGWIAAKPEVIAKCKTLRHYVSLCPGKMDDALAVIAFKNKDKIFEYNRKVIAQNLDVLQDWIGSRSDILSYQSPKAGLLCMLRYHLDISSVQLADRLAEKYSVLLAPGSVFDLEGYLRLGFGNRPEIFKDGVEQADQCFAQLIKEGVKVKVNR